MAPNEQLIELAKMDGWVEKSEPHGVPYWYSDNGKTFPKEARGTYELPDYINSRDAIVSLIEKQSFVIQCSVSQLVSQLVLIGIKATPQQLCEALLRATEKWKD